MTWSRVDLLDIAAVRNLLGNFAPDLVFHLAGHVTGSQDIQHVQPTLTTNLVSTVHLLTTAAETERTRLVLAGSMQEPDPGDPTAVACSPYAASKWACSGYARMFHALYQLPVAIARPMMVYGPGQWDTTKLLPYLTTSLLNGVSPAIGSGRRELDWVFIDDTIEGILAVAGSTSVDGQTLDLGCGVLTSIRAIAEQVQTMLGATVPIRFGAMPDRPLERPRVARTAETQRSIGWAASSPLSEGLARTVAWYREQASIGATS